MAGKRNNTESFSTSLEDQRAAEQPTEGGTYNRCADSGELTLVARTRHDAIADASNNVDSHESQA